MGCFKKDQSNALNIQKHWPRDKHWPWRGRAISQDASERW